MRIFYSANMPYLIIYFGKYIYRLGIVAFWNGALCRSDDFAIGNDAKHTALNHARSFNVTN